MGQRSGWSPRTTYVRFARWTILTGSRRVLAGGVTLGFFLLVWGLVSHGVISVGPRTPITSVLGSGVVAGLFSLISVTLAINQLISSRIFGGLSQMENRLEGGRELRDTISNIAGESPPIRTAALLSFIGETLEEQAHTLSNVHRSGDAEIDEALDSYVTGIDDYAEHLQQVSDDAPAQTVIATLAGSGFAHHHKRTDDLQENYATDLTDIELERLDAIKKLLDALSISRQYFKTVAIQQGLAQLSRQFIFIAFPAVMVALLVPLLYKTNPPAVLSPHVPLIASASLAVVIAPLVLVLAYILRIATIFEHTVTVAPFVPPAEWSWNEDPDE